MTKITPEFKRAFRHYMDGAGRMGSMMLQHMVMVCLDPCRMGVAPRFYEKTKDNKAAQLFTESRGNLLETLNLGPRAAERAISTLVDFGLVERLARPASGRQATYRLRVAERYDAMRREVERHETGTEGAI